MARAFKTTGARSEQYDGAGAIVAGPRRRDGFDSANVCEREGTADTLREMEFDG